jgi:hypothetical protein
MSRRKKCERRIPIPVACSACGGPFAGEMVSSFNVADRQRASERSEAMKVTDPKGREREVAFWDCDENNETLTHPTIKEAVRYGIDDFEEAKVPEWIEVVGWATVIPPEPKDLARDLVDFLIERMDCDYHMGHPDETSDDTPAMHEAATVFAAKFLEEFEIRGCEPVVKVEVSVKRAMDGEYDDLDNAPGEKP